MMEPSKETPVQESAIGGGRNAMCFSDDIFDTLTVISVNVQSAKGLLERMDEPLDDPEPARLLADAQKEIMRLAQILAPLRSELPIRESAEQGGPDLPARSMDSNI